MPEDPPLIHWGRYGGQPEDSYVWCGCGAKIDTPQLWWEHVRQVILSESSKEASDA